MQLPRNLVLAAGPLALCCGCECAKKSPQPVLVSATGTPQAPGALNFGNVAVGQSVRLPLTLGNVGSGPLNVLTQTVGGAAFSEPIPLSSAELVPGGKRRAAIAFAPTQAGPASGTVTFRDDGEPSAVSVALTGVGLDLDVTVAPASLDFGAVPVGVSPSPSLQVSLENASAAPLYLSVDGSVTAPEYAVTDPRGRPVTATPVQLVPGVPYVLSVAFSPDAVSIFNSSFSFTACQDQTTHACLSAQPVQLSGEGASGQLTLSPSPIAFNGVPAGLSSSVSVTVGNVGNAAVTLSCLYLQSLGPAACGAASSVFSLGATSALPATLAPGDALALQLTYGPSTNPTDADVLAATYTTQGVATVQTATDSLSASPGVAPCALSWSPQSVDLTYQAVGAPISGSVSLSNSGGAACSITAIAIDPSSDPSYALAAGQAATLSLPPGGSATIDLTFDLASSGPPSLRTGRLDFQSNDPSNATVKIPLLAASQTPYAGGGAWPRWHHDNLQSGRSPVDTSGLFGTIAWTLAVGAPTDMYDGETADYLNSPVVGSDGTVYQLGMNGTLYAVSPGGALAWATPLDGPVLDPHPGTPIIAADGTLFVAFGDINEAALVGDPPETNGLFHVASDGGIIAAIPPLSNGDGFDLPPLLSNGGLLLGADDGCGAFAFQIAADGTFNVAEQASLSFDNDQASAVAAADDTTYWCAGGLCMAFSPPAAGFTPLWEPQALENSSSATSDLALDEAFTGNLMVLFGNWQTEWPGTGSQLLLSVEPTTGRTVWTVSLPPPSAAQQVSEYFGIGDATVGNSCPAIGGDGTVYVGNFDGLHAVNGATGVEQPGFPFVTGSDVLTAPAIGGDGTIFFGTADGSFYAIHPDGTLRFQLSAGGRIAGSPAIGPSGAVYFTADDGLLYAVN